MQVAKSPSRNGIRVPLISGAYCTHTDTVPDRIGRKEAPFYLYKHEWPRGVGLGNFELRRKFLF